MRNTNVVSGVLALGLFGLVALPAVLSQGNERARGLAVQGAQTDAPAQRGALKLPPGARGGPLAQEKALAQVVVELADEPAARSFGAGLAKGRAAAARAGRAQVAKLERAQQALLTSLRDRLGARVLYRTQRVFNGIAVQVDSRRVAEIRSLPGVKAVHAIVLKHPDNANSVPFIGAPTPWVTGLGYKGEGIKLGVIDTGIDYLHANFGGPGAAANYGANDTTVAGDVPNYPGVKVAAGYDFVGDAYNGSNAATPDFDPMDCNGHGSHVAGSAGGYGVKSDGSTFTGPYGPGTAFSTLKIGPGVAPAVTLYALKVFGCTGSTAFTDEAIEWAVDPNGDGDFSDHLDVINMSLGSSFGGAFDTSAVAAENAALAGVVVVASAGNAGDTYYITGAPAAAGRAISVAASLDSTAIVGGVDVNSSSPGGLFPTGTIPAVEAAFGADLAMTGPSTGDLAVASPADGCAAITGVSGNVALIARGVCGFTVKVANAQAAGATGVLMTNSVAGFPIIMGGTDPTLTIPAVMTDLTTGDAIRAAITGGDTVNVTLTAAYRDSIAAVQPGVVDTIASFSSRGPRRGNALKPDVSSIGESVFSTEALSGTEGDSFNGTSMSSPHVAGTMAVLKQLHPTWSVEELKALVMNTANHDLFLNIGPALPNIGMGRAGAGREDVAAAATAKVVAYNDDGSGQVSVSFGAVEVVSPTSRTATIRVANKGPAAASYTVGYTGFVDTPGVAFTPLSASVAVPPGGSTTFDVEMTADPALMKHSRDASVGASQASPFGTLARHWISEEAGYVTLTPSSGPVLRVPVHVAARPASDMGTVQGSIDLSGGTGTLTVDLAGTDVDTGVAFPNDEASVVTALELQDLSPEITPGASLDDSADLRYVGLTNLGTLLHFGVATWGDWSTPTPFDTEFDVYIDTNQDATDDFVLFNTNTGTAGATNGTDSYYTQLCNLTTLACVLSTRLNGIAPSAINTVVFNTNVVTLPIPTTVPSIGFDATTAPFNYTVVSFNREVGLVDVSATLTYDVANRGLVVTTPGLVGNVPAFFDFDGDSIAIDYDLADFNATASKGLLLLHHHNTAGDRAQVLTATGTGVNSAPVASPDAYGGTENVILAVPAPGVLGNDTDADGDALTASLVSGPSSGTVTLNPNGSFVYTPGNGVVGTDSFTYAANDGTDDSNTTTVTITLAPNPCPIVVLPATLRPGSRRAVYNQTLRVSACAVGRARFTVIAGALPPGLTLFPTGRLAGRPTAAGSYPFTVMATDSTGAFGTRSYTLVIR